MIKSRQPSIQYLPSATHDWQSQSTMGDRKATIYPIGNPRLAIAGQSSTKDQRSINNNEMRKGVRSFDCCLRSSPMVLRRHRAGLEGTRGIYLIRRATVRNYSRRTPLDARRLANLVVLEWHRAGLEGAQSIYLIRCAPHSQTQPPAMARSCAPPTPAPACRPTRALTAGRGSLGDWLP